MPASTRDAAVRGQSIQDQDRKASTKAAFEGGGYEKDEQGNYSFTGRAKEHVDGMRDILDQKDKELDGK